MYRALLWGLVLLVPLPTAWSQEKKSADEGMQIMGKLSPDDPKDKMTGKPRKAHEFKMIAGKTYQIDLVSRAFDSFLRLEDESGKQLAFDDDGGGFPNARILFKAPKDGTYRIIATSYDGKTGDYRLTARAASETAVAATAELKAATGELQRSFFPAYQMVVRKFGEAKTDAERDKLLDEFSKRMEKHAERLDKIAKDFRGESAATGATMMAKQVRSMIAIYKGQIVVAVGNDLRDRYEKAYEAKAKDADELYKKAVAYFAEGAKKYASNAAMAGQLRDGLYLLEKLSIGKTAPEIEGEDIDGKQFKLSDYRGKVVVLDFWGNW
jgi:hypothetical protein